MSEEWKTADMGLKGSIITLVDVQQYNLFVCADSGGSELIAFDTADGSAAWTTTLTEDQYIQPVISETHGLVFTAVDDYTIGAYDLSDGQEYDAVFPSSSDQPHLVLYADKDNEALFMVNLETGEQFEPFDLSPKIGTAWVSGVENGYLFLNTEHATDEDVAIGAAFRVYLD
eukprot:m.83556 g.83556  ORF g.83556 m.83556 type:complete len:172 (+) comp12724_c1_seq1:187-702(+)